ncbi:formylglycine-generating enzyme family protein, partial [bacterium]|nr:formylglycine-generating enzyme family protein [bacterium]
RRRRRPAARPLAHDQAIKGALGEEMVLIPAGPFRFGPEGKRVDLPAYYIDKYPVTNEQYARVFPAHVFPPEEARHPVVKISWEQAMQFARKIGKRLPTEAEWEKAARGTDGRQYPWGNEFAPERCNTFESGMGVTTPVDAYPAGKSPMGVMDMAGNAWEWTATRHESAPAFRVLKGGAYDGKADFALCAQRFAYHQSGLFQASGFRCVKSAE